MSGIAGDELLEQVDSLGPTEWSGSVFRYTTARRDPMSGAGARLMGGRWNPPGLFPALYLAIPEQACMAELERAARSQAIDVTTLLQAAYKFHTFTVAAARVLDITGEDGLKRVGLTSADVSADDWEPCQAVGHAAWFLHFDGVLADSASGVGQVLTLFESRLGPGVLTLQKSEDLDEARYRGLTRGRG